MLRGKIFLTLFWIFYYASAQVGWQTATLLPGIKSLQVVCNDNFQAPPVLTMEPDQFVTLSFDELSDDISWISYRIIHCDANWQRSRLSELEYLDGFNNIAIEDAQPSFNTFTSYYHYRVTLPNEKVRFRKSGNYAVLFYKDNQPETVIAAACFSIAERETEIYANVTSNTDIGLNGQYQQVEFRLKWRNALLSNPADELKVVVSQNNRRDNEVMVEHPNRFSAGEAIFEHNRDLIFEAGNNYRRFEITDHRYAGIGVEQIRYFEPIYHVSLAPAACRARQPYYYDRDQNGKFVIRKNEAEVNETEADYFMVHFTLNEQNPFIEGTLHLAGDFTFNRFTDDSKVIYNFDRQRYEAVMLLKQGHYNYQYLFLPNGATKASPGLIEGNFHETENAYLIKVYHCPPGQRYDRLIGYAFISNFAHQ